MSQTPPMPPSGLNKLFRCLSDSRCRRILGILHDRSSSRLTARDLATFLVPEYHENPINERTRNTVKQVHLELEHALLPKLDDAGLIAYDRETVRLLDHAAFHDSGVLSGIHNTENQQSDTIDALFGALCDARRRTILRILNQQPGPMPIETLGRKIAEQVEDERDREQSAAVDEVIARLHHADLPQLLDAGVVDYDPATELVAYLGHPSLRVAWLHGVLEPDLHSHLTEPPESIRMRTIEDRTNRAVFIQSLIERATEEIICHLSFAQPTERGYLTRLTNAARERGVTVFLGIKDERIRENMATQIPEAHFWDPTSIFRTTVRPGERIASIVMTDRTTVLCGITSTETTSSAVVRAFIGDGTDHPLVVLTTYLVAPIIEATASRAQDSATGSFAERIDGGDENPAM